MTTAVPERIESVRATWQHLPALDGLRACAVIAVLLFHGGYLEGGFLGVDLFFALSGFLITSLLVRDAERIDAEGRGIELMAFWGRRFRRLLPAVFAMIAIVALWSWWFGSAADLDGVKRDGPWAVVYLANWHLIAESVGYWASFAQPSMFDHLWSLAIEEQFYVLWPLVVLAVWRWSARPQRTLAIVCALGIVASFVTMLALYSGGDPTRVYMGTDTRASSLLVGALCASTPVRQAVGRLVSALGVRFDLVAGTLGVLILASWFAIDGASSESLYRGGLLAHSVACALLVVLVASVPTGDTTGPTLTAPRVLGWRPLAWIGTLSYGLYLWHWPIYVVVSPDRVPLDGVVLLALRLALSFAAAAVSLRLVENPIRYRAAWARGRLGAIALVAAVAGLLAFLFALPEPKTEIAQFDPTTITAAGVAGGNDPAAPGVGDAPSHMAPDDPDSRAPAIVAPDATDVPEATVASRADEAADRADVAPGTTVAPVMGPLAPSTTVRAPVETISTVLWAGDSVAFDMALGVEAALREAGIDIDETGAFPGLYVTADGARQLAGHLTGKLTKRPADTVIMLISAWDVTAGSDDYRAGLVALLDDVEAAGAERVIVVTAPPVGDDARNVELDRLAAVVDELAAVDGRVLLLDASAVWTTPVTLDANGDGAPERKRDRVHVCPAGAAQFGVWLADTLASRFVGLTPVEPSLWAGGPWTTDPRYDEPVGACAPV